MFLFQRIPITIPILAEAEQLVTEVIGDHLGKLLFVEVRFLRAAQVKREFLNDSKSVNYPSLGLEGVNDARGSPASVNAVQPKGKDYILARLFGRLGLLRWLLGWLGAFAATLAQFKRAQVVHGYLAASAVKRPGQNQNQQRSRSHVRLKSGS